MLFKGWNNLKLYSFTCSVGYDWLLENICTKLLPYACYLQASKTSATTWNLLPKMWTLFRCGLLLANLLSFPTKYVSQIFSWVFREKFSFSSENFITKCLIMKRHSNQIRIAQRIGKWVRRLIKISFQVKREREIECFAASHCLLLIVGTTIKWVDEKTSLWDYFN